MSLRRSDPQSQMSLGTVFDQPKRDTMPLRNEKVFTDDEMIRAFSLILPPERAREWGISFNSLPDLAGFGDATAEDLEAAGGSSPRSYDGDILDLLSLVSESCAERAWLLLGVSPEEGARRRESIRRRVEEAQGYRDGNADAEDTQ